MAYVKELDESHKTKSNEFVSDQLSVSKDAAL